MHGIIFLAKVSRYNDKRRIYAEAVPAITRIIIKERTAGRNRERAARAFATIKVCRTLSGKPVPRRERSVLRQKTHDFGYGANIFMLDEFETEEKNAEYRRVFGEYFNMATVPFYWDTLEPDEGHPRFAKDSNKGLPPSRAGSLP